MNIIDVGKESLDIIINDKTYRLSGELTKDGFVAWFSRTSLVTKERVEVPFDERVELAHNILKTTPDDDFVRWLTDKTVSISTDSVNLDEAGKHYVMREILKYWTESFQITFLDDCNNILGYTVSKQAR